MRTNYCSVLSTFADQHFWQVNTMPSLRKTRTSRRYRTRIQNIPQTAPKKWNRAKARGKTVANTAPWYFTSDIDDLPACPQSRQTQWILRNSTKSNRSTLILGGVPLPGRTTCSSTSSEFCFTAPGSLSGAFFRPHRSFRFSLENSSSVRAHRSFRSESFSKTSYLSMLCGVNSSDLTNLMSSPDGRSELIGEAADGESGSPAASGSRWDYFPCADTDVKSVLLPWHKIPRIGRAGRPIASYSSLADIIRIRIVSPARKRKF